MGKYPYNLNKDHVKNVEIQPADHLTKKFILNPVEGSRLTPTRSSNQNQSVLGWQWGQDPWKRFPYVQVSGVLCYKQIPIIYRTSLLQNSLKVIIIYRNSCADNTSPLGLKVCPQGQK